MTGFNRFETPEELKEFLILTDDDVRELERPKSGEYKAASGFGFDYAIRNFTSKEDAIEKMNRYKIRAKIGAADGVVLRPGDEAEDGRPGHDGRPSSYAIYKRKCPYCKTIHWVYRSNNIYCANSNCSKYFSRKTIIPGKIFLRVLNLYEKKLTEHKKG